MLEGLDRVPWNELEHAYGTAEDVPDLMRSLLDPDPVVRKKTIHALYGNVFHQGTRCEATPYVIPFLIELCESPEVPGRAELLEYWGDLIAGYFNVQERPCWGDGEFIHFGDTAEAAEADDPFVRALYEIYRLSLKGYRLITRLLEDGDGGIRAGAAWMMACLPTQKGESVPMLEARLGVEVEESARAAIAFALGELGAEAPLRRLAADDESAVVRCMAACELARIAPDAGTIDLLLPFLADPIPEYEGGRGAGGTSTGDAAFSLTHLPRGTGIHAIGALCDQLDRARDFETMPLVMALLSLAFPRSSRPAIGLDDLQWQVLKRMTDTSDLWRIGNLSDVFPAYGLPWDRMKCKRMVDARR